MTSSRPWRRRAAVAALCAAIAAIAAPATGAQAATFGSPTIVSGANVTEPGIDVATDGTVYVNAPTGLLSNAPGSPSDLFRSGDGGASFVLTPPGLRSNFPGGGDFDISVDPATGTIYSTDLWLGSATVGKSTDKGQTWLAHPLQGTFVQDRQWIATSGGGIVYHVTHQIPSGLIVSKSTDGLTYPQSSVAATPADQTGCVCPPGSLIAEGGGGLLGSGDKVGVIYATSTGGVKFARSTNGGTTFSSAVVGPASSADTSTNFPVVANAGGNRLAAVWLEVEGGRSRVEVSTSTDWGATWSAKRALVSAGTSVYPWVAAKGNKVAVSVYNTSAQATPDTAPAGSQWFEGYTESADGGATFSALQTVDPTVVKSGPICTGGTNCSANRELGDFQALTLDNAGFADLTWVHSINNQNDTEVRFVHQTG